MATTHNLVVADFEGTLVRGGKSLDYASEFVTSVQKAGMDVVVVSNSSRISTAEMITILNSANIPSIPKENIISGAKMTIVALNHHNYHHPLIFANQSFTDEIRQGGFSVVTFEDHQKVPVHEVPLLPSVDSIVIASDFSFDFDRASLATRYVIERKIPFFSVDGDRFFPWEDGEYIPGSLSLAASPKTATYTSPIIIGKPSSSYLSMFPCLSDLSRAWVVGDNPETDIAYANSNGARSVLVLTGATKEFDTAKSSPNERPTAVCGNLRDALKIVLQIQQ